MPAPNAMMTGGSYASNRAAASLADSKNRVDQTFITPDPNALDKPKYYIGVFNVSRTEVRIARPWVVGGMVKLAPRQQDDLYGKPFVLPDIKAFAKPSPGGDEINLIRQSGEFLAQDIVNCNDPKGNWKTYRQLNPEQRTSDGNNYYERGIFWCRIATPESEPDFEALEFAVKLLEKSYQSLIEEANIYYASGPKEQAKIGAPHREAAQYFIDSGLELNLPWHQTLTGGLSAKLATKKAEKAKL